MSTSNEKHIRAQLERWREMFSLTGKGLEFSLEGYTDLYAQGKTAGGMLTFDSYVPAWATTQIDGFDDYRSIWEKDVNENFPGWTITRMDILRIEITGSEDLAWSALNFWGEGTKKSGEKYYGSQHGTHVWRNLGGVWTIVHEHLTAPIMVRDVANAEINGSEDTRPQPVEAGDMT